MDSMTHLDVGGLSLVAGVLVPLLVGLVTKYFAKSSLKAVLNLGLCVLAASAQMALATDGNVKLVSLLGTSAVTWVVSVASYYGFWDPTGVSNMLNAATFNFGLGSNTGAFENLDEILKSYDIETVFGEAPREPDGGLLGDDGERLRVGNAPAETSTG